MSNSRQNGRRRKGASVRRYELAKSPFFRLERPQDLAKLLHLTPAALHRLICQRASLYVVREDDTTGKVRTLTVPVRQLRRCHDRIFRLLRRVVLPDYIRSPRRKSTAWANAALHLKGEFITSFDVKAFYPSTTEEHVFRFFRYRLETSDDCARLLAMLCTHQGFLPLGSPMSPHLACLVHLDLFEEADEIARGSDNKMSVWVDDVAVSGRAPRRDIMQAIKRNSKRKGLEIHKLKRGGGRRGIELTGAYLRNGEIAVANSSHIRIRDLTQQLADEKNPHERFRLLNRLAGMARHQRTIVRHGAGETSRLDARLVYYRREMKKLEAQLSVTEPSKPIASNQPSEGGAPF